MNKPLWDIEYSLEARNYLYDSYPYTESVLNEIEVLRIYEDALPEIGTIRLEPGLCWWQVLDHFVAYERHVEHTPNPLIRIIIVKPLDTVVEFE